MSAASEGRAFADYSDGSERLQEDQDYCLVCDDVLVKCESEEESDSELSLEEKGQSCLGGGREGFGVGGELMGSKFCELFGVTGPVKRWMAVKIRDGGNEKSLFCEGCDAQLKMLIELKIRVEQLEEKLEGGKTEIKGLVKMAEGRGGKDELRRSKEIRRIRQQILRGRDNSRSGLQTKTSIRILTREPVVVITQEEREKAEDYQTLGAVKEEGSEWTPMNESDFPSCDSDSDEILSDYPAPRPRRLLGRSAKDKMAVSGKTSDNVTGLVRKRIVVPALHKDLKKLRDHNSSPTHSAEVAAATGSLFLDLEVRENLTNNADGESNEDFKDLNSAGKKRSGRSYLKDGIYTYDGTTLRICEDDNGKTSLFKCDTCGDLVPRARANLRHHVLSKHIIKQCKLCGKVCSLATLKVHLMFVHRQKLKTVTCSICGRPDIPLNISKRHKWSHLNSEERLEFLAKVGDKVPSYAKVWNHSVCDICGVTVKVHHLPKHMHTVHATQEDRKAAMRICPICGRAVVNLEKHMKAVHSEGKYPCPYCENRTFKNKMGLRAHVKYFHSNKPFQCTICDRAFKRQNVLEAHMNCHLGIRPFSCDHCEMTFTNKINLRKHCKIYHTEGREPPRRKSYVRGPDKRKKLVEG